jgi:hypothetical protein
LSRNPFIGSTPDPKDFHRLLFDWCPTGVEVRQAPHQVPAHPKPCVHQQREREAFCHLSPIGRISMGSRKYKQEIYF